MSELEHSHYRFESAGDHPYMKFKDHAQALGVHVVDGISVFFAGFDQDKLYRVQWFFYYKQNWYSDFIVTKKDHIEQDIEMQLSQVAQSIKLIKQKS
jgi:hypothetical protein